MPKKFRHVVKIGFPVDSDFEDEIPEEELYNAILKHFQKLRAQGLFVDACAITKTMSSPDWAIYKITEFKENLDELIESQRLNLAREQKHNKGMLFSQKFNHKNSQTTLYLETSQGDQLLGIEVDNTLIVHAQDYYLKSLEALRLTIFMDEFNFSMATTLAG